MPIYLLLKLQGVDYGIVSVYERTNNGDVLVWSGHSRDLPDEFDITGEILEEDLHL